MRYVCLPSSDPLRKWECLKINISFSIYIYINIRYRIILHIFQYTVNSNILRYCSHLTHYTYSGMSKRVTVTSPCFRKVESQSNIHKSSIPYFLGLQMGKKTQTSFSPVVYMATQPTPLTYPPPRNSRPLWSGLLLTIPITSIYMVYFPKFTIKIHPSYLPMYHSHGNGSVGWLLSLQKPGLF